jgi:hypothetical protein
MACCNCQLFTLDCLRAIAGIPRWVQNDNENLVSAYNDVVKIELEMRLGDCFAYFCDLKQQIEDNIITKPVWWDVFINGKLMYFAGKMLKYYAMLSGISSINNESTVTAETQSDNFKVASSATYKQAMVLWEESKKWLDKNAKEYEITCWTPSGCDTCKKADKFSLLFTPPAKKTIY